MGGTDNPYAALSGMAAQNEFLKRQGDINAKEIEMQLSQLQQSANIFGRLEEWNRQNRPDVYHEYKGKVSAAFGVGARIEYDGSVTMPDGSKKAYNELTPAQKELVNEYNNAMGWDQNASNTLGEGDKEKLKNDAFAAIGAFDSEMDTALDYGDEKDPQEMAASEEIANKYAETGKAPTRSEVAKIYSKYGQKLPDGWDLGNDPDWWESPAW